MEIKPNPSWPAASHGGALLVAHPAWEEARNAILDWAAAGPVSVALIGPSGAGKTWLLQELAGCLGDHGFPTMVLMQGDLPAFLSDGAALLIDRALVMPEPTLDRLLTQDRGVVILADVEQFGPLVQARSPDPIVIVLRPLDDAEMSAFIDEWLQQSGYPPDRLDPVTRTALIAQTGGLVGRAVPALAAALSAPPRPAPTIIAPEHVAPEVPKPVITTRPAPRHHATRRVITASTALAACFTLAWAIGARLSVPETTTIASAIPAPAQPSPPAPAPARAPVSAQVSTTSASLPPLRAAEVPAPPLALQSPAPATTNLAASEPLPASATPLAPAPSPIERADVTPLPDAAPAHVRLATASPVATTPAPGTTPAAIPQPPEIAATLHPERVGSEPTAVASLARPPVAIPPATMPMAAAIFPAAPLPARPPTQPGGVGIVLLAQRGDTLQSLYRELYRDRPAPPYAEVVAANPHPIKPGGIVVFPAPPGGWSAKQTDLPPPQR